MGSASASKLRSLDSHFSLDCWCKVHHAIRIVQSSSLPCITAPGLLDAGVCLHAKDSLLPSPASLLLGLLVCLHAKDSLLPSPASLLLGCLMRGFACMLRIPSSPSPASLLLGLLDELPDSHDSKHYTEHSTREELDQEVANHYHQSNQPHKDCHDDPAYILCEWKGAGLNVEVYTYPT